MFKQIQNRIDRWRLNFQENIDTPEGRKQAARDGFWFDHGLFRAVWTNMERVDTDVWRSNQPSPEQIDKLEQMGIRTILSLRHEGHFGSVWLERRECERRGMDLRFFPLSATVLPSAGEIERLNELFDELPRPFLIHCKSGADRAGLASALYLLMQKGETVDEALKQLSLRFLHQRWFRAGVLDKMLLSYKERLQRGEISFLDWVRNDYDPDAITRAFNKHRFAFRVKDWQA